MTGPGPAAPPPRPAPAPPSPRPAGRTVVAAVTAATVVVALGLAVRTERLEPPRPVPSAARVAAPTGHDAALDLAAGLPPTAEQVAGRWEEGEGGARVTEAAPLPRNPLLAIPVDGPPWATVDITGSAVDGWSVVFGVDGPDTYWAASLRTDTRTVEVVQVVDGRPTGLAVARPIGGAVEARARVRLLGRQVQVDLSGVALPTVTVGDRPTATVGLLGRGAAATPGVARWGSVVVDADPPRPAADLPPLLGARHVSADDVRAALGG